MSLCVREDILLFYYSIPFTVGTFIRFSYTMPDAMKLFKTNAIDTDVKVCREHVAFELPSVMIEKRKKRLFCHVSIHLHVIRLRLVKF